MQQVITPEKAFGRRLREERERRKISLTSIATTTKIGASLLAGLECDDLSRWPSGIFRRSFVRAYAEAVGLDPDEIVREFLERYPDHEEVAPVPTDLAASGNPPGGRVDHPRKLRVRVEEVTVAFRRGPILSASRRRWAAAAWDAGVLAAIALLLFAVVNSFWKPFGVLMLIYYIGGILLLGNTPGVSLFAPESEDGSEPVED